MGFARLAYLVAGLWGIIVIPLGYVSYLTGTDQTLVTIARPEIVHGFFLLALPWQLLFILISRDPARYNPVMPFTVLEKLPFAAVTLSMFARGQVTPVMGFFGAMDGLFGVMFCVAYWLTRRANSAES
jgi:hypothetical protein